MWGQKSRSISLRIYLLHLRLWSFSTHVSVSACDVHKCVNVISWLHSLLLHGIESYLFYDYIDKLIHFFSLFVSTAGQMLCGC